MFHSSWQSQEQAHPYWGPELLARVVKKTSSVILGHDEEISLILIAMLAGGHVLLEDVPGVGKTKLVRTLSSVLGCDFGRIQFTSDLMPGDITGTMMYHPQRGEFQFKRGPVLSAHLILADEINRASSRAQSALLELMEEGTVSVDGETYPLQSPFFLLATQNPMQFEGTNRLPEAQLDRFMMKLGLGYPHMEDELLLLQRAHGEGAQRLPGPLLAPSELLTMQRAASRVYVDDSIQKYLVQIAASSRTDKGIRLGISPRAVLAWMRASQGSAFMDGRMYVIPDDCLRVAVPVLAHRLQPASGVLASGWSAADTVKQLLSRFELPRQRAAKGGRG
ncbi:MoxR family ATPase [Paenibacillus sp. F411]|uniref:AAA family ATPase n=1 Tax=Paenibacillus sp. F411 TaxID=2820239 RepID=UPI001FB8E604|nr:MoxR family ATPase [Paenibacillus sp. F411]